MKTVTKTKILKNGNRIPALGFGTWGLDNAEVAVQSALETGYRHIDTAKIYNTEAAIGKVIGESPVPREEIFITTKLWNTDQGYDSALRAIDESLQKLDTYYVDLYLIHWPFTHETVGQNKREETWYALERICEEGKARAIGVSNYTARHLEEMERYATIPPMVNQIELHPFGIQDEVEQYCHEHGIVVVDYAPLTRGEHLDHPRIQEIAEERNKSPAQVLLRWGLQRGNVVIPKSSKPAHIEENFRIFDFELDDEEMARLTNLDRNESVV